MQTILKIILIGSILLNLVAIWGFFHYVRHGGSPLGELKRLLTRSQPKPPGKVPFADENEAIKSDLANGDVPSNRVVFFGASITNRWDLEEAFPNITPINRGVGGQLVPGMMTRFQRDVIDLKPDAVTIKYCSINIRPHMRLSVMKDAMVMMIDLAKAHIIKPIPCTIIPAGKPEAHIGDFSIVDSLNSFNEWLREYTAQQELPLIDYARAIADENGFLPRELSVDPVHLNEKGYAVLNETARPVLSEVLNLSTGQASAETARSSKP